MSQTKLSFGDSQPSAVVATTSGPPNRMNDLSYKDWMKFQKSFFWYRDDQLLVEECVTFFTKAVWPSGEPSRSLIIGFGDFDQRSLADPRIVEVVREPRSFGDLVEVLKHAYTRGVSYDFILIDLRNLIRSERDLSAFLTGYSQLLSHLLRRLLVPQRYCGLVVGAPESGGSGFPLPWSVAVSLRCHLRLRDERIGLHEDEQRVYYCLFFQAEDDARPASALHPGEIRRARYAHPIPGWIMPKSPPRRLREILHPAKYPETLVAEFLKLFTKPGDRVLDPMVGTGSTVVAAVSLGRHGYGVELSSYYAQIAEQRVAEHRQISIFGPPTEGVIIQGDATRLSEIEQLRGMRFDYVITSPPYWSMLTNPGSENQRARRRKNLPLVYSSDERDLGNIEDYDQFLATLKSVYDQVADFLVDGGHLTVVVKNVKRNHIVYPLAWDLVSKLCDGNGRYDYVGNTLWCQDDIKMKPFAVGCYWVSNTVHTYCLHFKKR